LTNLSKKIIFIHIPKTAGTSINLALEVGVNPNRSKILAANNPRNSRRRGPPRLNRKRHTHALPEEYKKYWKSRFTFTVIRNPWDRLLSTYMFNCCNANTVRPKNINDKYEFRSVARTLGGDRFSYFVKNNLKYLTENRSKDGQPYWLKPMSYWFDKKYPYDKVLKFETLQKDYSELMETCYLLGINIPQLLKDKYHKTVYSATKYGHCCDSYIRHYDSEMIDIVQEVYEEDIDRFDYRFGD